jgi:hypothetical protein
MKTQYYSSDGQLIFDRSVELFPFFIGLFWKAFVYSPLLLTGYVIARLFLTPATKGYYWAGVIIGIAMVIYTLLFIVKGVIIAWRARGVRSWQVLMLLCIIYTSFPPAMIVHHFLQVHHVNVWVNWGLSAVAGLWVYGRYHFLVDLVPHQMWGFYATGLRLGRHPAMQ